MKYLVIVCFLLPFVLEGQKKVMDESVYDEWKRLKNNQISNNGDWICYETEQIKSDPSFNIYNTRTKSNFTYQRASSGKIDFDNKFVAFLIHPSRDSVRAWKKRKVKKKDFVKDTLAIYSLETQKLKKIPNVTSFKIPEKWGSGIAYVRAEKKDSSKKITKTLVFHDIERNRDVSYKNVKKYTIAKSNACLLFSTEEKKNVNLNYLDCGTFRHSLIGNYLGSCKKLAISENGKTAAYLIDPDTLVLEPTKVNLFSWQKGNRDAKKLLGFESPEMPKNYTVSKYSNLTFSETGDQIYFGVSPLPLVQDTTLIKEEIVNVEVWTYKDQTLYTQQENKVEDDKKTNYMASYDLSSSQYIQYGSEQTPVVRSDEYKSQTNFLGLNDKQYRMSITSLGYAYNDVYLVSKMSGKAKKILTKEQGRIRLSPSGNYSYWFNSEQQIWKTLNMKTGVVTNLTKPDQKFSDERNDRPMDPRSYGVAFWTTDDAAVYINDRYDLWRFDPDGNEKSKRVTKGRKHKKVHRYIDLSELDFESNDANLLLHVFDENDKSSGYGRLDLKSGKFTEMIHEPFNYTRRVMKAKDSDDIVYTKQSFTVFPDLIHSNLNSIDKQVRVTELNPQQEDYNWGTIELVNWKSDKGKDIAGLLLKPEDFDPSKKYPVIINFYERNSDGLHRHRAPFPHRSTINYAYYVNRGYVIFNPDVHYEIGYPGRSALNAVMSGTEMLKKYPWVDQKRIGLQGHSWGGYQIAHILTKTDIFACAESGAPVVNMVSAYGGIRWGSGMSRMFQYEKTQSRIGGTLWEKPELYLENSPIFNLDKHVTPVLILHNDNDGAVPWYQGIEYFVGLRRLGRPAWFLNYNGEPHWPLKLQNRLDFNKRMQQFFDHFLKDEPLPSWMDRGIPELEKGINDGFNFSTKQH